MFQKERIKTIFLRIYNLITYRHFIKENTYGIIFNNATRNIDWLKDKVFFPSKSAANYSFLYIYLRILIDTKPKKILEFGLGQSSILSSAYANAFDNVTLNIIEHNQEWIDIYENNLSATNTSIVHSALENRNLKEIYNINHNYEWYENIPKEKYNLIVVDAPNGTKRYSRVGSINLIPEYLAEDFIILFDDCNVFSTRETVELVKQKLKKK